MFYTIYKITNKINGKTYIGMHKTDNLEDGYMGSGKLIRRAIQKHGQENFIKEILHIFDNEEDMKTKEKEVVVLDENSYNLIEGGHGGFGYINRHCLNGGHISEASRSNLEKNKGNSSLLMEWMDSLSEEQYKNWKSNSIIAMRKKYPEGIWKNKKHKPETIELMKTSSKGKQDGAKNSQYGTCWITNGSTDKKIKKEELDLWIEQGYYRGRVLLG